ncbi:MAG: hypothetical protein CSA21_02540 [Deltaproteobacteria bacterium]|nr:MAG: hypothetical protein CSA21_02540 [Deltaproteobacteria bacterium]
MFGSFRRRIWEKLWDIDFDIRELGRKMDKHISPDREIDVASNRLRELITEAGADRVLEWLFSTQSKTKPEVFSAKLMAVFSQCSPASYYEFTSQHGEALAPYISHLAAMESVSLGIIQTLNIQILQLLNSEKPVNELERACLISEFILSSGNTASLSEMHKLKAVLDAEVWEQIQGMLFTFDDLVQFSDESIRELLREVTNEGLSNALAGASNDVREVFFRNLSDRAKEMVQTDMDKALEDRYNSERERLAAKSAGSMEDVPDASQDEFIAAQYVVARIMRRLIYEGKVEGPTLGPHGTKKPKSILQGA